VTWNSTTNNWVTKRKENATSYKTSILLNNTVVEGSWWSIEGEIAVPVSCTDG